jgi:hypothetical protein
MPNDVFRAIDAMLVLAVDDAATPEGAGADELIAQYDLSNAVGRLRNVSVMATTDLQPFYEIGQRYPTHLRPGVVKISGTAEHAHVNGALLRLLLGEGAASPPGSTNFVHPSFNMIANLNDPSRPGEYSKLSVFGVKFSNWSYSVQLEDFVMEHVSFQARRLAFEEA